MDGEVVQDVGPHQPEKRYSIPLHAPPMRNGDTLVVQSTLRIDDDVSFVGDAQVQVILEGEVVPERPAIGPPQQEV